MTTAPITGTADAGSQIIQLEVTYTDPVVDFGPISGGLRELPEAVCATFIFPGNLAGGTATEADVLSALLEFGDGVSTEADLAEFSVVYESAGTVTTLNYLFGPINTPTMCGLEQPNFPLFIIGTDCASGEDFQYRYLNSQESLSELPPCPADTNFDGEVDVEDLTAVILGWGGSGSADVNNDGTVDVQDLTEVILAWGPCG